MEHNMTRIDLREAHRFVENVTTRLDGLRSAMAATSFWLFLAEMEGEHRWCGQGPGTRPCARRGMRLCAEAGAVHRGTQKIERGEAVEVGGDGGVGLEGVDRGEDGGVAWLWAGGTKVIPKW